MRENRQMAEEPARDRKYFNEEIRSLDKIKEKLSRLKSDIIQDFRNPWIFILFIFIQSERIDLPIYIIFYN